MKLASRIASCLQMVTRIYTYPEMVTVTVRSNNEDMTESTLYFNSKHPDFKRLVEIKQYNMIEFEFHTAAINKQNKQDAVAYLRLKEPS